MASIRFLQGTCRIIYSAMISLVGRAIPSPHAITRLFLPLAMCVASSASAQESFLIEHVSLIDMTTAGEAPDMAVLVEKGRVARIGRSGTLKVPNHARRIDGRGRYLIPGLSDMHVHVWAESELPLYIASGVTLVRNMTGEPELLAMARRTAHGDVIGPTIVTAGRLTDGPPPIWGEQVATAATPQDAIALMDGQQAAGFGFFKIYENISLEVFDSIARHSKESGFRFAGHVPQAVPLDHALRSGMWSMEHLTGWISATHVPGVLLTRADEPDFAKRRQRYIDLAKALAAGTIQRDAIFSPEKRKAMARLAADNHVAIVPTLFVNRALDMTLAEQKAQLARPGARFMAPDVIASWNPEVDFRRQDDEDDAQRAFSALLDQEYLRDVRDLKEAGAVILAGTDAPNPYVLHGFSLADELDYLVKAGLTPFEALTAATRAPAQFLGLKDRGTIAVGNRADLVLLDADPLADINATRRVAGVMLKGHWLDRAALDAMLDGVVKGYRIPPNWFASVPDIPGVHWARRYRRGSSGAPVGVERIGERRNGEMIGQASLHDGAAFAQLTWLVAPGAAGTPMRIAFAYQRTLGNARLTVEQKADGIHATGVDFAGHALRYDLKGDHSRMSCAYAVCTEFLLPDLLKIGVGESNNWRVALVDQFQQRIYSESWHVARLADASGSAVFQIDAVRGTERYTIEVHARNGALLSQKNSMMSEVQTIELVPS